MISVGNRVAEDPPAPPPPTLAELLREEMTAWDAVLKTAFRVAPYNPDDLLTSRGFDIYERMMNDAMVRAAINTKRFALLAKPWQVFPAVTDARMKPTAEALAVRDFVEAALRGMRGPDGMARDFRQTLFQIMSAFYRGFSVAEMLWRVEESGPYAGKYVLAAIKGKAPKQIGFQVDDYLNVQAITSWTPQTGLVTIPRSKCVLYIYNPHDELPYGDSDLRAVYKHWWSKDTIVKFWNLALQKYGMPMVYAQAANSANDAGTNKILETLRGMQQDSSAVFPRDVTPQLLQATLHGGDAFVAAVDWHNQQIAQGVLLQTLTSGEGRRVGSMALGRVHFSILLYALENAKADIEAVVNTQIIRPLVDYNFSGAERLYPRFALGTVDEKDFAILAQAYDVLLKHGVVDNREQAVREAFDLPPLEE
jgi:phage gp29-like protein